MTFAAIDHRRRVDKIILGCQRVENDLRRIKNRVGQWPEEQGVWFSGHPNAEVDPPTTTTSTTTTTTTTTTTSTTTSGACPCDTANQYEFSITYSGAEDCCNSLNGHHTLYYEGESDGFCIWSKGIGCDGTIKLMINYAGWAILRIPWLRIGYVGYSFNCSGSNVMYYTGFYGVSLGSCDQAPPSTITVTKV